MMTPFFSISGRLRILQSAVLGSTILLAAQGAYGHGETLILIREKTRQIETATNNAAYLHLQRAELYREHQLWEAAAADYDKAAQLDPTIPSIEYNRGRMLFEAGKLEEARRGFDKVLSKNPSHGEALFARARVLAQSGESERALAEYRQSLDMLAHPAPDHYLEAGQNFLSQGRTNDAVAVLDAGMKKFGPVVSLQKPAVDIEFNRQAYDAALKRLESIVHQSQRKENWLALRGEILLAANRPAEAREALQLSLAAIGILPGRLQQGPPMMQLRSRIETTLMGLTHSSPQTDDRKTDLAKPNSDSGTSP